MADKVNNWETSGDVVAWRVGRSLLAASLGLLVTSGLFYLAVVLLVRGDWPAEAARPEGFVGVTCFAGLAGCSGFSGL